MANTTMKHTADLTPECLHIRSYSLYNYTQRLLFYFFIHYHIVYNMYMHVYIYMGICIMCGSPNVNIRNCGPSIYYLNQAQISLIDISSLTSQPALKTPSLLSSARIIGRPINLPNM